MEDISSSATEPLVIIVDDDPSVRKSLVRLLRSAAFDCLAFDSANAFLASEIPERLACLVLDVRMPGLSGLDLQDEMGRAGLDMPVVFITGHGDVPTSVRAMKAGAADFLEKPFDDEELLEAIRTALENQRRRRKEEREKRRIERRVGTLTRREREVMEWVITGLLNKQIAARLGATEKTIKVHRGRVMEKMEAGSLAELVVMTREIGIRGPADRS